MNLISVILTDGYGPRDRIEDLTLPRVPQIGETVDWENRVYTVTRIETALKTGRIFVFASDESR